jgi:DNA-binding beta-propeller fold protein YncE
MWRRFRERLVDLLRFEFRCPKKNPTMVLRTKTLFACLIAFFISAATMSAQDVAPKRLLYVATPGIRNYLEYGGHGVLVFDMDAGHKFVKRILTAGVDENGKPLNVKGICASAATKRLYVSTIRTLQAFDLITEKLIWEKAYDKGCDRMAIAPDGSVLYVPSLEQDHWVVVDGTTGDVLAKLEPKSGAHNTIYGLDGKQAFLAGLKSPSLTVADTSTHTIKKQVGPFSAGIRPFTVNGRQTLCYVCVNELLGFEVGDLTTGKPLHKVAVEGFSKGAVKRHGCPSHGIGLTPDEKEIWVCDAFNEHLHVYDVTVLPPKRLAGIKLRDEPGWVTFSLDGKIAYPSTGDIIDVASRKIVGGLTDENGTAVQSEKMVEIQWKDHKVVRTGDQFGVGRVTGN